jgi:mono/diheme cytochrome c family protein
MRTILTRTLIFAFTAAAAIAMIPYARPQDADQGQIEFLLNCAGCHSTDAKGSGPLSAKLDTKPADLTVLAKRNHGLLDAGAVYQMIDGRNGRVSHHSAEMPISDLPLTHQELSRVARPMCRNGDDHHVYRPGIAVSESNGHGRCHTIWIKKPKFNMLIAIHRASVAWSLACVSS